MAMLTVCNKCGNKIPFGSKCECVSDYNKQRYKYYNKYIRNNEDNKEYNKFYNSKAWRHLSKVIANRYHCLCVRCVMKYNKINTYNVIHHIVEIREDMDKALDDSNLIPLCHSCHNEIHSNYDETKQKELYKLLDEWKDKYIEECDD